MVTWNASRTKFGSRSSLLGIVALLLLATTSAFVLSQPQRTGSSVPPQMSTIASQNAVMSHTLQSNAQSNIAPASNMIGGATLDSNYNVISNSMTPMQGLRNASSYHVYPKDPSNSTTARNSLGIIVPLYTVPSDPSWQGVISAKRSHENIPMIAIINPANGPGSGPNHSWSTGIQQLRAAGVEVVGYVATGYGQKSIDITKDQVKDYSTWYKVDGIFFDEMASSNGTGNCDSACTIQQYYSQIASYASSLGYGMTIGNPGQNTVSSLKGIMRVTVIYENSGNADPSLIKSSTAGFDRSSFAYIGLGVSLNSTLAQSYSPYVSWIYMTDLCTGQSIASCNPYAGLPSYFDQMVSGLGAN
jgi:hypothetical protein